MHHIGRRGRSRSRDKHVTVRRGLASGDARRRADLLQIGLVAACLLTGCEDWQCSEAASHRQCPEAASIWQTRRLTVEQMRTAVAPFDKALARELMEDRVTCPTVPIGVDARNDLPVFIQHHCDDVCPDYAQFLVIYDEAFHDREACEEIGACALIPGALGNFFPCLPFGQGYHRCYSEDHCNWNESCEPENQETPFACPKECACGEGLTGSFTDWLAAEVAIPVRPEEDEAASYCDEDLRWVNSASSLMAALSELLGAGPDLSAEAATAIREGEYVLVARLQADDPVTDDYAALWLAHAPAQPGLALDGEDVVTFDTPVASSTPLCGHLWDSGNLTTFLFASGDGLPFRLPLPGLGSAPLRSTASTAHSLTWNGPAPDLAVTAIVPLAEVDAVLVPALAEHLNALIAADPTGPLAVRLAAALDGVCGVAQCPEVVPGEGDCAASTPPVITPTEVRCHQGIHAALQPNVDAWAAPTASLFFGFRISRLVPVSLVEP